MTDLNAQLAEARKLEKPEVWISSSQLGAYRSCNRQWFYSWPLKLKGPGSQGAFESDLMHLYLEHWVQHQNWDLPADKLQAKAAEAKANDFEYDPDAALAWAKVSADEAEQEVSKWLAEYREGELLGPAIWKHARAEVKFQQHGPRNTRKVGKIDVVFNFGDGLILLLDWKSTKSEKWVKTVKELQEDDQVVLYSAWAANEFSQKSVPFMHVWTLKGKRPSSTTTMVKLSQEQRWAKLSQLDRQAIDMAAWARGGFDAKDVPQNTDACNNFGGCAHRERCFPPVASLISQAVSQKVPKESAMGFFAKRKAELGHPGGGAESKPETKAKGAVETKPKDDTPKRAAAFGAAATPKAKAGFTCCSGCQTFLPTVDTEWTQGTAEGTQYCPDCAQTNVNPPEGHQLGQKPEPRKPEPEQAPEQAPKVRKTKAKSKDAEVEEPTSKATDDSTSDRPFLVGPTGRWCFIGCFPTNWGGPKPVLASIWMQAFAEQVASDLDLPHYSLVEYGRGKAMMQGLIAEAARKGDLPDALVIDRRDTGDLLAEVLAPYYANIVNRLG